jgi:hypothetical protein
VAQPTPKPERLRESSSCVGFVTICERINPVSQWAHKAAQLGDTIAPLQGETVPGNPALARLIHSLHQKHGRVDFLILRALQMKREGL